MNTSTRQQAIAIAAAIFAARDLASKDPRDARAARAIEDAVAKARFLVDVIERKIAELGVSEGERLPLWEPAAWERACELNRGLTIAVCEEMLAKFGAA